MNGLTNISREGKWTDSVNNLNGNFIAFESELGAIENDIQKCKGLFPSLDKLRTDYPSPEIGSWAYVGSSLPAPIYVYRSSGGWTNTGKTGGSTLDPTKYANSTLLNGNASILYSITTGWLQNNGSWSSVSNRQLKINGSVTQYKLNISSLKFGEEGELLKVSTTDPYLYVFNKGSFVSMVMTSSSGITKTFTTGSRSWIIDSSYYTRTVGTETQNRLPVVGDTMRASLSFKSAADNDVKVVSTVFKFSN